MKLFKNIFKGLFKDDFKSKDSEIASLRQSILNLKSVSSDKDNQINRLEVDTESLRREIDERNVRINRLNDDISTSKRQLAAIRNSYDMERQVRIGFEDQIERFRQKEVQAQEEARNREKELMTARQESDAVKEKLSMLKNENKLLQNDLENNQKTYSDEITTLKSENKDLSDNIGVLKHEKEQLENSSQEKSQSIENLEKKLCATVEDNALKISELESKLEMANQSLSDKLTQIDKLNDTIRYIRNKATEEQSNLTLSLQDSQNALHSKIQECENLKQQVESASNAAGETLKALKADISSKQEEISRLELKIQKLNESISDLRTSNEALEANFRKKEEECSNLKSMLESLSETTSHALETERLLSEARDEIESLKARLQTLPSESELIRRDKEIERLKRKVNDLDSKIKSEQDSTKMLPKPDELNHLVAEVPPHQTPAKPRPVYRKPILPYIHEPAVTIYGEILKKKDFPKIENDNLYATSSRLIDEVYNCKTDRLVSANNIFLKWTAEEISHLRFELDEAVRKSEPYLTCPCCHQMVIISSRSVGFGKNNREIQYFKHAVKNIPCDLKRDYTYTVSIDGVETGIIDRPDYLRNFQTEIYDALTSKISSANGVTDVKIAQWIFSKELPIMKRRLADITASYRGHDIVFELVTPTTNSSKLHDRDIFYLINKRQVFWILGLNSKVDYNELRRSVAKDIMFTNRRNVFVFDIEAQEETKKRGELMLKCNWLDENGDWNYQVERTGTNGIFISLDRITFDDDSCRPYYKDADEAYFLKHPSAERPPKLSRDELKKSIIDRWNYVEAIEKAKKEMSQSGTGIEAFYNDEKWGFRHGSLIFIEPRFTEEPIIHGNLAKVCEDGKFGVVDRLGNIILSTSYEIVEILPNDGILYSDKKEWHIFGIIDSLASYDSNDNIKVERVSENSKVFHLVINKHLFQGQIPEEFYFSGEQIFKKDKSLNKWTLWSSNGIRTYGTSWDSIEITNKSQLKLINEDNVVYLSPDGSVTEETIIKHREYLVCEPLGNGKFIIKDVHNYWGIVDGQDNDIVTPKYDMIEILDKKYLRFQSKGKWGVITIDGNVVIEAKYKSIESSCEEGFNVSIPNPEKLWESLYGLIDRAGNEIRKKVSGSDNGIYISKSFERYGIEFSKRVIVQHIYQSLIKWDRFKFIAQKDDKYGIISVNGKVLLPFEYSQISPLKDNRATVHKGSRIFHINADCKIVEDEIITLQQGFKKIKKEGKWGIIAPDGVELVAPKYDEITTFRGRLIGIINGRLVKLAAYYPYRLQMSGITKRINGKDMVQVSTILFQLNPKRKSALLNAPENIVLTNWTSKMKYPTAAVVTKDNIVKKAKHIDRPEDFIMGETFVATVTNIITKKTKFKSADILTESGKLTHVYSTDFNAAGIDPESIAKDYTIRLTKIGYNEEFDRTIWRVEKISG